MNHLKKLVTVSACALSFFSGNSSADVMACLGQVSYNYNINFNDPIGQSLPCNNLSHGNAVLIPTMSGYPGTVASNYTSACLPQLIKCLQEDAQNRASGAQNSANKYTDTKIQPINTQLTDLTKTVTDNNTSVGNSLKSIENKNTQQDQTVSDLSQKVETNNTNVNQQISDLSSSIDTKVNDSVTKNLPDEVAQNLNQVVQEELTNNDSKITKDAMISLRKDAENTMFPAGSGELYVRSMSLSNDPETGSQWFTVKSYHPEINFCSGAGKPSEAFAKINMSEKNASVIVSAIISAYSTGKPIKLITDIEYDKYNHYQCYIKNLADDANFA